MANDRDQEVFSALEDSASVALTLLKMLQGRADLSDEDGRYLALAQQRIDRAHAVIRAA